MDSLKRCNGFPASPFPLVATLPQSIDSPTFAQPAVLLSPGESTPSFPRFARSVSRSLADITLAVLARVTPGESTTLVLDRYRIALVRFRTYGLWFSRTRTSRPEPLRIRGNAGRRRQLRGVRGRRQPVYCQQHGGRGVRLHRAHPWQRRGHRLGVHRAGYRKPRRVSCVTRPQFHR